MTEADIEDVPTFGTSSVKPPPVVTSTANLNWPSLSTGESYFDKALANGGLEGEDSAYANGSADALAGASSALDAWAKEEGEDDEVEEEEGGWGLDPEGDEVEEDDAYDVEAPVEDEELAAGATPGVDEADLWIKNSPFAVDHVAAGSFESAMQVCLRPIFCHWCSPLIPL